MFKVYLGFTRVFKVSFKIHTEENKEKKQMAVKTGSRGAEEQEVEPQKHMTQEKKKVE